MSFGGVVKHRKNWYQKRSPKRSKSITLASGRIFEILESFRNRRFFDDFWLVKNGTQHQKNQKTRQTRRFVCSWSCSSPGRWQCRTRSWRTAWWTTCPSFETWSKLDKTGCSFWTKVHWTRWPRELWQKSIECELAANSSDVGSKKRSKGGRRAALQRQALQWAPLLRKALNVAIIRSDGTVTASDD